MKKFSIVAAAVAAACCVAVSATRPLEFEIAGSGDDRATLTVYPATEPTGVAVLGCPGGGYEHLAVHHEGVDWVEWFDSLGVTYAMLRYRMPHGRTVVPLADAEAAMRVLRGHAAEWGIESLGVMGFSAGGHLASTLATHAGGDARPDFQILFYPVITMQAEGTHMGSRRNLLGDSPADSLVAAYSGELQADATTPPAIIFHCGDDELVPVSNSLRYYEALQRNGVDADLHIYPHGGHGWGFNGSFAYKPQWQSTLEAWLIARKRR